MNIEKYTLTKDDIFITQNSSKGSQIKFYKDDYWYKLDNAGYEGFSEYLVSKMLEFSNINNFVKYEYCLIEYNDKIYKGCRSKNFLNKDESFQTFQNLYSIYFGGNFTNDIMIYRNNEERMKYVIDTINNIVDFDCSNYLKKTFSLDAVILNDDRHFHNLGFIQDDNGIFREAPIFDNGRGLLSDLNRYPIHKSIESNKKSVIGCPVCANLETQAALVGFDFSLDTNSFINWLHSSECLNFSMDFSCKRALDVLESQIECFFNKNKSDISIEKQYNNDNPYIDDEELEYY